MLPMVQIARRDRRLKHHRRVSGNEGPGTFNRSRAASVAGSRDVCVADARLHLTGPELKAMPIRFSLRQTTWQCWVK
jgi:hypothetical protein